MHLSPTARSVYCVCVCGSPLPHGVREIFLRVVVEAAAREHVVPARDFGNERSRRDLVQSEVAVHSKQIAIRDAIALEAALSKTSNRHGSSLVAT